MSLKRNASGCYDSTAFEAIMNLEGSKNMNVYKGEIFYIKKGGRVTGSEQFAERPAVVVSNDIGNVHSNAIEVVYLTSQSKKELPTHAKVMCSVPSTALCEQIHTVSKERLGSYIRTCTEKEMNDIDAALMISLGLNGEDKAQNNSAEVEQLKAELEEAGAKIKELEQSKVTLENDKEKLADSLIETSREKSNFEFEFKCTKDKLDKSKLDKSELNIYVIQLETERDLYKEQYEALLERLINQ